MTVREHAPAMTHAAAVDFDKYRLRRFVERLIDTRRGRDPRQAGAAHRLEPDHRAHRQGGAVQEGRPGAGRAGRQDRGQPQAPRRRLRDQRGQALRRIFHAGSPARSRWSRCRPATRRCTRSRSPARTSISPSCRSIRSTPMTAAAICSSAIDYTIDPATGRRNVGCRRLSLRNRYEAGTNVTAPSDLKRIYTAAWRAARNCR